MQDRGGERRRPQTERSASRSRIASRKAILASVDGQAPRGAGAIGRRASDADPSTRQVKQGSARIPIEEALTELHRLIEIPTCYRILNPGVGIALYTNSWLGNDLLVVDDCLTEGS